MCFFSSSVLLFFYSSALIECIEYTRCYLEDLHCDILTLCAVDTYVVFVIYVLHSAPFLHPPTSPEQLNNLFLYCSPMTQYLS